MSASMYGPWGIPPACNSSAQCQDFLQNLTQVSGLVPGLAVCYNNLHWESSSAGGCACDDTYGLGGASCNEQTSASPSTLAMEIIVAVTVLLVILRFIYVMFGMVITRGIWKFNAAGTTYLACWIALIFSSIEYLSDILNAVQYNSGVRSLQVVTGRMQIIFLAIAVLNLVGAFVEMSISVKLIHNVDKLKWPLILLIVTVVCLIIFTYLFAATIVSTTISFVVVFFICIAGFLGPLFIYVKASERIAKAEGLTVTRTHVICGVFGEICSGQRVMKDLLGITRSSSSKDSKDSKDESKTPKESGRNRTSKRAQEKKVMSKHEEKMVSFLSRAVQMGFWLTFMLIIYLGGAAANIALVSGNFINMGSYIPARLVYLIEGEALCWTLYQILWFLDAGYSKTLAQRRRVSRFRSRSESKELVISKEDSKLDIADDSKDSHKVSRDQKVAVPHSGVI